MLLRAPARFTHKSARAKTARRATPRCSPRPSGALINAVIQHADLIKDLGGHQSLLRVSDRLVNDADICRALGAEAPRLKQIAVIWNDEEDQIVRVLDAAAGDVLGTVWSMEPLGDRDLVFTPKGEAYLKASKGTIH